MMFREANFFLGTSSLSGLPWCRENTEMAQRQPQTDRDGGLKSAEAFLIRDGYSLRWSWQNGPESPAICQCDTVQDIFFGPERCRPPRKLYRDSLAGRDAALKFQPLQGQGIARQLAFASGWQAGTQQGFRLVGRNASPASEHAMTGELESFYPACLLTAKLNCPDLRLRWRMPVGTLLVATSYFFFFLDWQNPSTVEAVESPCPSLSACR